MSESSIVSKSSGQPPHLEVRLRHCLGTLDLAVDFALTGGWTILFGPSGSGKTTILRAIAGLLQPQEARVVLRRPGLLESQLANDTAAGVFVAPHRRWVRWSAQTPALFPNLTVSENLRLASGRSSEPAVDSVVDGFRLGRLANSYPASLSGGERQRVSVARAAMAANGRLLMLDEPFNGLDARLRDGLLEDLRGFLKLTHTPVLSVTHDLGEALQLADEVIRIADGCVQARGDAATVLGEERSRLIAQLNQSERSMGK